MNAVVVAVGTPNCGLDNRPPCVTCRREAADAVGRTTPLPARAWAGRAQAAGEPRHHCHAPGRATKRAELGDAAHSRPAAPLLQLPGSRTPWTVAPPAATAEDHAAASHEP